MRALVALGRLQAERGIREHLRAAGHVVECADTGEDALEYARRYEFDVIVLGLQLPDAPGAGLIRRLRAARVNAPILALAPSAEVGARVAALQAGADDVVVLPLDRAELDARLQALLRRSRGHCQQVLSVGPVSFNLETRDVVVNGAPLRLTVKETAVLELLLLRCNLPLSKETFLGQIYADAETEPDPKIVDVFICKLRKKLADAGAPNLIETVWGRGYMMRSTPSPLNATPRPVGTPVSFASMLELG